MALTTLSGLVNETWPPTAMDSLMRI
jgi:hypothetical protein